MAINPATIGAGMKIVGYAATAADLINKVKGGKDSEVQKSDTAPALGESIDAFTQLANMAGGSNMNAVDTMPEMQGPPIPVPPPEVQGPPQEFQNAPEPFNWEELFKHTATAAGAVAPFMQPNQVVRKGTRFAPISPGGSGRQGPQVAQGTQRMPTAGEILAQIQGLR